ncbi:carbohydrate ABC transporter permease [Enterococcus sp. JM9B]|uniref:carbohydrate ABC transporter permease n=1 Tax=Enterococcus sp. JM9B TaxID=1857216 RepID=UPI001374AAD8|nr:sugar ABC transporter permease [Enterococcus sp. JM9B]KAF1303559.1 sugar ABC transporter permease [Enterococcus sp. JM9B]
MKKGKKLTDSNVGIILILPALAIFGAIILYPFINSIIMSFSNRSLVSPESNFIGFENYINIFKNPQFFQALKNTGIFVFFATMLPFCLGLIWAMILDLKFRGAGILRGATLVNWIIPGASISFLWAFIFDTNRGIMNEFLKGLGIISENQNWLGSTSTAMFVVIIARTWQMLPWYMAFLTGGLQSISYDQIEAARMDGASNFSVLKNVVIPGMKPIMIITLVLGIIGNLQHFDIPQVLTSGGPAGSTTTLSIMVYREAFSSYRMGTAATIGTIWAILLGLFSFLYSRSAAKD